MDHSNRIFSGHYPNHPRVAVGAVVFKEDKVLLVLRGKPPAEKQWSIPGGCVELVACGFGFFREPRQPCTFIKQEPRVSESGARATVCVPS